jgi:hypothetical protein
VAYALFPPSREVAPRAYRNTNRNVSKTGAGGACAILESYRRTSRARGSSPPRGPFSARVLLLKTAAVSPTGAISPCAAAD